MLALRGQGETLQARSPTLPSNIASQRKGRELFNESFCQAVRVSRQKSLEFFGVVKRTAIRKRSTGVHRWIITQAPGNFLVGSPTADGVVVVECEPEGVRFLVT